MALFFHKDERGASLIEILVVIALAAVLIISLANVLGAVSRLKTASESAAREALLAEQAIEIVTDLASTTFACVCPGAACSSCTRLSDSQSCSTLTGYRSCWTEYPKDQTGQTSFALVPNGSTWDLAASSSETIDTIFHRRLEITNVRRDGSGNIVASGGTPDWGSKRVRVTVWRDNASSSSTIETILTGWRNL